MKFCEKKKTLSSLTFIFRPYIRKNAFESVSFQNPEENSIIIFLKLLHILAKAAKYSVLEGKTKMDEVVSVICKVICKVVQFLYLDGFSTATL